MYVVQPPPAEPYRKSIHLVCGAMGNLLNRPTLSTALNRWCIVLNYTVRDECDQERAVDLFWTCEECDQTCSRHKRQICTKPLAYHSGRYESDADSHFHLDQLRQYHLRRLYPTSISYNLLFMLLIGCML